MNDLGAEIKKILDEYGEQVSEVVNEEVEAISKQAKKRLSDATRSWGKGRYSKGWSVKKESMFGKLYFKAIVYNKLPGLPHLLENSHTIANQYGTYGKSNPKPHIKQVNEWVAEELPKRIRTRLNK